MKNIPSLPLAICLTILLVLPAARAGTAESNIITVDTRQLKLSSLVVSGPSSLALGSEAPYTATLNLEGGQVRDVTSECQWTVTGGPKVENFWEMPAMNGNVLDARVASATPLKVAASFLASTGRIASTPIAVTVTESNGMNIGLGFRSPSTSKPHYIGFSGGQHGWRVVVEASGLAALKAGVTFRWFLDGVQVGTGKTLDYEIVGQAGERQLSVVATDLQGRTGQTFASLVCDCPPGAGEPDTGISAQDPGVGEVLDENGQWFAFDASKKANGLIVLTHGLKGGGIDDWLQAMAKAIRLRLEASGKVPNIVIYGWGAKSDPTTAIGYDAMLNRARAMATNFVQEYTILGTDMALNMLLDILIIRPSGQEMGLELADWIRTETLKGNISTSAPIHLIGHSAGGFVMGESGWSLRSRFSNCRVTMLDTPFPYYDHVWRYPDPGKLDRYVSSFFGRTEFNTTLDSRSDTPFRSYRTVANLLWPTPAAHSYSHEWYLSTIPSASAGSEGFGLSPFLSSGVAARSLSLTASGLGTLSADVSAQAGTVGAESTVPLTGFTTFGSVVATGNSFVLSEVTNQNAGIVLAGYQFPAGTRALRFSFRFTTPGDGDFLSVVFGDSAVLFTGKDMPLTRDELTTVDVPVEQLDSETGDLVFRLVSRGTGNAVLALSDIQAVVIEDLDQDGLSNAQETAAGTSSSMRDTDLDGLDDAMELNVYHTDPISWDTDGDGLSDGDEVDANTDPKNPASRFAVSSVSFENNNLRVDWLSQHTRKYRVQRSTSPGFESYDVIASGIQGNAGTTGYADPSPLTGQKKIFYRIQLDPVP